MSKPTTGKLSMKLYRCTRCNHESYHGTNHWGEIYPTCPRCSWKNPLQPQVPHECLEKCPKTHDLPAKWKMVRLGDICEIK